MRPRAVRQCPRIFQLLCGYLGLSPAQSRRWWEALGRAQYSQSSAFRRAVVVFESRTQADVETASWFVQQVANPQGLIEAIEALVHEKRLSRAEGNTLEEAVLNQVIDGQWK